MVPLQATSSTPAAAVARVLAYEQTALHSLLPLVPPGQSLPLLQHQALTPWFRWAGCMCSGRLHWLYLLLQMHPALEMLASLQAQDTPRLLAQDSSHLGLR